LIEAPISNIIRLIHKLEKEPGVASSPVAAELEQLLTALASTDLYHPQIQKLIESQDSDPVTRSHLVSVFMPRDYPGIPLIPTIHVFDASRITPEVSRLKDWGFNFWTFSIEELEVFIFNMFESFDLIKAYSMKIPVLNQFIRIIRQHYFSNPYHNFQHAFAVVHSVFSILSNFGFSKFFTQLDILALLLAALGHDLEHPGVNNAFLIKTNSPLAILYNDSAVLENHHVSRLYQLLKNPAVNILADLSKEQFRALRKSMIDIIIATDMEQHFTLTTAFEQVLLKSTQNEDAIEESSAATLTPELRTLTAQMVIKCADICNVALPYEVALPWFERIAMEFFVQGEFEKLKGFSPPPFMDKEIAKKPKISYDFSKFIGRSLFEILVKFDPACQECLEHADFNMEKLEKMHAEGVEDLLSSLPYSLHPDHFPPNNPSTPRHSE
jgi:hypothetical protein